MKAHFLLFKRLKYIYKTLDQQVTRNKWREHSVEFRVVLLIHYGLGPCLSVQTLLYLQVNFEIWLLVYCKFQAKDNR